MKTRHKKVSHLKRASHRSPEKHDGSKLAERGAAQRKRISMEFRRTTRALTTLGRCNQVLVHATSESELLNDVCRIIVYEAGYRLAWVGYAEDDAEKSVRPVAYAGFESGYLEKLKITWADTERGRGPTGTAIRTGRPCMCKNALTDPNFEPWREDALKRGYASSIVLPLDDNGVVFGGLSIYAAEPNAFDRKEMDLLTELADDLSFGILALRNREERYHVEEALRIASAYNRSLIEASLDPLVTIGPQGTITDVNQATETVTGRSRTELIGTDFSNYFTEPQKAREGYERAFREGFVKDYELELLHRDGRITSVRYNASVYRDASGKVAGLFAAARDITERKKIQQAMEADRLRFYQVLEKLPAYLILLTPDYRVSFANRVFRERFGESHGKRCYEYLFGRELPCENCETYKVLADGQPRRWEWTGPDERNYDVYDFPFADADGSTLILEMGLDITERKRAETEIQRLYAEMEQRVIDRTRALAESERRFHTIYETAPVSIWQEDWNDVILAIDELRAAGVSDFPAYFRSHPEFVKSMLGAVKIFDVNEWALGMFSARNKAEMLASLGTVFAVPDTLPSFIGQLNALAQGQEVYRTEITVNNVKGELINGLLAMAFPPKGSDLGNVLVCVVDITERKRAEESLRRSERLYRAIGESIDYGVWVCEPDGRNIYASESFLKLVGLTQQQCSDFGWGEVLHPEDAERTINAWKECCRVGGTWDIEHRFRGVDGQWHDILARGVPVRNEQGEIIRWAGINLDISRLKKVEQANLRLNETLEKRAAELEAANKELEAFSYSVSHDLRAPLRGIDGFSAALLEDFSERLDETGKDYLRRVREATQRMGVLIDDMLELSRLTRSELHIQTVNLSTVGEEIADELQRSAPERRARFDIGKNIVAEGDPPLMRIVLENLLGNAWKFTGKTPGAHIEFGVIETENGKTFFVRDNGIGFDMQYADRLFGAFQRLHSPSEFPGTGIGLATVQRIIHRHVGRVWAESAVGVGTTFYFTLFQGAKF